MYVCLYTHTGNTLAEARAGLQGLFSEGLTELRHSLSRKQKPAALIRLSGQQALGIRLPPVLVLGASTAMAGSFTWVLNSNSGLHDYRVSLYPLRHLPRPLQSFLRSQLLSTLPLSVPT